MKIFKYDIELGYSSPDDWKNKPQWEIVYMWYGQWFWVAHVWRFWLQIVWS